MCSLVVVVFQDIVFCFYHSAKKNIAFVNLKGMLCHGYALKK